jgi:uncharacterized protein with NRDE domain
MCTLILGVEVLGPNTLLLGANRDESPERPAVGPGVLVDDPRVVGGRDLLAGGTWLAVREGRFVAALMNRRPGEQDRGDAGPLRSRGLLCLETATASGEGAFLDTALESFHRHAYGHCTLVGVGTDGEAWWVHAGGAPGQPRVTGIARGWHVITHEDLDNRDEPRTRAVLDALGNSVLPTAEIAVERIASILRRHDGNGDASVCLHRDRFPTVSSSILALGALGRAPRYLHAAGPPCVAPYVDCSHLLAGKAAGAGGPRQPA